MNAHPDPDVETLPDGRQIYTPRHKGWKLLAVLFGVAVLAFGFWWQLKPVRLVLFGGTAEARVAYVKETRPGLEPIFHDTVKSVGEAEDPSRKAVYYYFVRFETDIGQIVTAQLNYGHTLRPLLTIGEVVTIAYERANPENIIDKWSVRTWAFGFFFIACGLLIFIPQVMIYRAAGKPIVVDSIPDYDELDEEDRK